MISIEALLKSVSSDMEHVERTLRESITSEISVLRDICTYVIDSGGKRLRPLMLLLTARFCDYRGDQHIPLACVLEYIHTATLLHDDVIDHADLRRGAATANQLWGNQATILAGDFFFSRAFSWAVDIGGQRMLEVISRASQAMAEAEIFQVVKAGDPLLSERDYFYIVENKTATLISAASTIGGILGAVSSEQEQALTAYGSQVGIAFQIMDDVLDYSADEADLGKTIGKDLQEGSVTLPFILAMQAASQEDRSFMEAVVRREQPTDDDLGRVVDLVDTYAGGTGAKERARIYIERAVACLDVFPDTQKRQELAGLAYYVIERQF
ncbi:MAG: polyprenyl synthetase family protein [Deltaproteobacteria bacterium]|nr:polyprenyl synthetase family protein [Deltaproteobacteria bacterium]